MEDTVTLTKRFVSVEWCCPRQNTREETEAESTNN